MLSASDIKVSLGRNPILHGVSLQAHPGEVTAVIGPNGSGKTTFMRALTGELPFEGSASLNGIDISKAPAWKLAGVRGVLAQSTSLAFPFTVYEVVRLGLTAGVHPAGLREAELVSMALARVDLAGFGSRYYQELSGGEQQRVQLARVLCQVWEPSSDGAARYLFLDEPVSSLDVKHQLQIMQVAAKFAMDGGAVFAIMHDLNLTAAFADSVTLLKQGRVYAQGSPKQVLEKNTLEAVYECPMRVEQDALGMGLLVVPDLQSKR
ncbi:MAG: heme ABC transporter ATP-binding protein [Pseudomonadota bacterium]